MKWTMISAFLIGLAKINSAVADGSDTPELIKRMVENGVELQQTFEVNDVITGYALVEGGEGAILFSIKGTNIVVNGDLLDANGKSLNLELKKEYLKVPEPDFTAALEKIKNETRYFESPKKTKKENSVWVIHDPNCGYCKRAWKFFHVNRWNDFNVNWIPVAALGVTSLEHSALLVGSKDPGTLMNDLANGLRPSKAEIENTKKHHDTVRLNTQTAMKAVNARGTPVIIIQKGDQVSVEYGFNPARIEDILSE